jgi:formylmethanofuran dehydrogenase subunit E
MALIFKVKCEFCGNETDKVEIWKGKKLCKKCFKEELRKG